MDTKQVLLWLPMIVLAFANAAIRELVFMKHLQEIRAHQFSTITLIILCSVYIWFIYPALHVRSTGQALLIGFVWVVLTILFEFSLGRLTGKSWEYLLADYHLLAGRIWPVFLFCLFILPCIIFWLRRQA